MTELNASIRHIPMPKGMARLPLTEKGFPVLFFADEIDGKPDLRVMDGRKFVRCINEKLCWLCGGKLGVHMAFVSGPMCVITRTSSEPPSHYDCANYAARACPFLTQPRMRRNEKEMPAEASMAGIGIKRNPGCCAIYVTRSYKAWRAENGVLVTMGEPERVEWWAEGRQATRAEISASIESGYPLLQEQARRDKDPIGAEADLALRLTHVVDHLVPAA